MVFGLYSVFLTRLPVSGILFSYLSISYLVFKTNLLLLILFTLVTNLSYSVFLKRSFFTRLLNLLKSVGTDTNLSMSY